MTQMANAISRTDSQHALKLFADWSDRIAAGEIPAAAPARPTGAERNIVLTVWDWSRPTAYLHDEVSTDKRKPTVNANGRIFGAPEESTDFIPVLDPIRHTATEIRHPVRDPNTPSSARLPLSPSAVLGRRPDLGQPDLDAQPDVRRARPRLVHRARAPAREPGFLSRRIEPPGSESLSDQPIEPSAFDVRPEVRQVHADQHVLLDPSPGVRRGCQPDAVDQWRRGQPGRRLARSQAVRGDRRRGALARAGLRSYSTPTATAGATRRSSPISRSIRRKTSASRQASMVSR